MRIRDFRDLHFALHRDHERAFVERLDPADVGASAACQASEEEGSPGAPSSWVGAGGQMADEPDQLPPLRRVTNLRTGEVFWQRSWTFERLRAEILYAPMNGTLRSWLKRRWFRLSWRWNREPWVRWTAERLAKGAASRSRNR